MSDTLTDYRVELRFNPTDAAALLRTVDPDGDQNGSNGITVVSDESVEPSFVNVVVVSGDPAGFTPDKLGLQKAMDFDPLTGAIITLSHNAAGDLEATRPWARDAEDGTNLLDTPEGREQWDSLVGLPREEVFAIAASHAEQVMIQAAMQAFAESLDYGDDDDVDPDTTLDGPGFIEA